MESIINIKIEKLPEGLYLATSDDIQGLIAQGRTIAETLEIARDVAKKLIEAQKGGIKKIKKFIPVAKSFNYPLVIGL
jgi:predicted RNase H-like HicB family nuclease